MKKNSKNKLKQVCMFVEKLGKKLVSLSSFFLSFFTRGFARRLKDDAHICCIYDKRTFNIEWNSFFSLSWKKGKIRKTIINATP